MPPVNFVATVSMLPLLLAGQTLRLQPDIATAEAAYRDAQEAWLRSDPNLERDLFTVNRDEARRRVKQNAGLREEVMVKKQAYLDLLIQRTDQIRSRVVANDKGMIPAETVKKDLEQQQSRILAEQDRLEQLLRDLPPGDEYLLVRRPLEDERMRLVNLQNNIAQRIRSLDTLDKAQQAIEGSINDDLLAARLDAVLKLWENERAANARQRSHWAAYYAAMERALAIPGGQGAAAPTARSSRQKGLASAPPARKPSRLAGVWTYRSQPDAWTGYGEPAMVTLELRDDGGVLRGSYAARLPVKSGTHDVRLAVESVRQSPTTATLRWKSANPSAEGEMEIKLSPDGRLLLQRSHSGDSFIPLGSEVLLPK